MTDHELSAGIVVVEAQEETGRWKYLTASGLTLTEGNGWELKKENEQRPQIVFEIEIGILRGTGFAEK